MTAAVQLKGPSAARLLARVRRQQFYADYPEIGQMVLVRLLLRATSIKLKWHAKLAEVRQTGNVVLMSDVNRLWTWAEVWVAAGQRLESYIKPN